MSISDDFWKRADIRGILRTAQEKKTPVLLDLVMGLGEKSVKESPLPPASDGYHTVIPIRSVEDYLAVRKTLVDIGDVKFFDSIMVGYKGLRLSHAEFDVNSDQNKAAALYKNLKSGREITQAVHIEHGNNLVGFPRFLIFKATFDQSQGKKTEPGKVRGFASALEQIKEWSLLLSHKLHLRTKDESVRSLASSRALAAIIARPWVNEIKANGITRQFHTATQCGDKTRMEFWPSIGWSIHSKAQVAQAPNIAHLYLTEKIVINEPVPPPQQAPSTAPAKPVSSPGTQESFDFFKE